VAARIEHPIAIARVPGSRRHTMAVVMKRRKSEVAMKTGEEPKVREVPRYRLLAKHIIADVLREPGEIVELTCEPSFDMAPLNDAAAEAIVRFRASRGALDPTQPNYGLTHFQIRQSTQLDDLIRGLRR
jgi:hypothetical protein